MVVHTLFVEPFNPIIGAQYIVLGEIENTDGKERLSDLFDRRLRTVSGLLIIIRPNKKFIEANSLLHDLE